MRQFLKVVGVTSQREIEKAVRGAPTGLERTLVAKITLTIDAIGLDHVVDGEIELG